MNRLLLSTLVLVCGVTGVPPPTHADACTVQMEEQPSTGDIERGQRLFLRCRACHTIAPGGEHLVGPNLAQIFSGRPLSAAGFEYSAALLDRRVVWTDQQLDAFLKNPADFLPGSSMLFAGLDKAQDRADLIAYLRRASGSETC
ncbi:MAG: cytochrome c family protein [Pseudomonadota bacterium]